MKEKFYIGLIVLFLMLPSVSVAGPVSFDHICYPSSAEAFRAFKNTFPRVVFGEKTFTFALLPSSSLTGDTLNAVMSKTDMFGAGLNATTTGMTMTFTFPSCQREFTDSDYLLLGVCLLSCFMGIRSGQSA